MNSSQVSPALRVTHSSAASTGSEKPSCRSSSNPSAAAAGCPRPPQAAPPRSFFLVPKVGLSERTFPGAIGPFGLEKMRFARAISPRDEIPFRHALVCAIPLRRGVAKRSPAQWNCGDMGVPRWSRGTRGGGCGGPFPDQSPTTKHSFPAMLAFPNPQFGNEGAASRIDPGSEGRPGLLGRERILVCVFVKPGTPAGGGACRPRRRNGAGTNEARGRKAKC